jgi:hypothetical protein
LEASPATTFRACSSPAPTPVNPQPATAILSQESVHTILSITHHTGSDHPPVLKPHMVLNLPLDECINNTQDLVTKEKRKRKKTNKKKSQQAIESQRKTKNKIT